MNSAFTEATIKSDPHFLETTVKEIMVNPKPKHIFNASETQALFIMPKLPLFTQTVGMPSKKSHHYCASTCS
jgi:hypothetical protein